MLPFRILTTKFKVTKSKPIMYRYNIKYMADEGCIEAFSLKIFKNMYAKIKYATFNNKSNGSLLKSNDYQCLIKCIRKQVSKLNKNLKNEIISLSDPNFGEEISEFNESEKVGINPTFDARVGNKYTRKTFIKQLYNKYYNRNPPPKIVK